MLHSIYLGDRAGALRDAMACVLLEHGLSPAMGDMDGLLRA